MTGRGPGWPTVLALALVVLGTSVFHPLQLMALPWAFMLVALPPRNPRLLAVAAGLVALVFLGPRGSFWAVERGWTLLVGAWFVLAVVVWPRGSFVTNAVAAVGAAVATGGALIAVTGGWEALDWTITLRFRETAEAMIRAWPSRLENAGDVVQRAAALPAELFPALLAVGSVAALAVAWWGYGWLGGAGERLGRLPEFRFPDVLVWVLIGGLVLVLLPVGGWTPRLGGNLVFFMSALYALRGLAVVVALVGSSVPTLVVMTVVGVILYPIVVAGTLLVGVTDTWLDLRAAGKAAGDEG